jgi:ribonuclease HI
VRDPIEKLSALIAEHIEASWERCEAGSKAMEQLDHLANEGRAAIARSRIQLARLDERQTADQTRPLRK